MPEARVKIDCPRRRHAGPRRPDLFRRAAHRWTGRRKKNATVTVSCTDAGTLTIGDQAVAMRCGCRIWWSRLHRGRCMPAVRRAARRCAHSRRCPLWGDRDAPGCGDRRTHDPVRGPGERVAMSAVEQIFQGSIQGRSDPVFAMCGPVRLVRPGRSWPHGGISPVRWRDALDVEACAPGAAGLPAAADRYFGALVDLSRRWVTGGVVCAASAARPSPGSIRRMPICCGCIWTAVCCAAPARRRRTGRCLTARCSGPGDGGTAASRGGAGDAVPAGDVVTEYGDLEGARGMLEKHFSTRAAGRRGPARAAGDLSPQPRRRRREGRDGRAAGRAPRCGACGLV